MDFKAVIGACLGPRTVLATQIAIILNNIGPSRGSSLRGYDEGTA